METKSIELLGNEIPLEWPPDWEGGPMGSWPKGPSQLIQYYGTSGGTDIKLIWEFHRLQWLPSFAAVANSNEDYELASEILDVIIDYSSNHPTNKTIAWMEGIEVSIRSISIIESLSWIKELIGEDDRIRVIYDFLFQHASWINSHLSQKWRLNNNHLLIELIGLQILSERISWAPQSRKWKRKSLRLLKNELRNQIIDGRDWEPTTSYHKLIAEGLVVLNHHIGNDNSIGGFSDPFFTEVTEMVVSTLSLITDSAGNMPLVGDDDSGSLLPIFYGKDIRSNTMLLGLANSMGFMEKIDESNVFFWRGQGMGVIRGEREHVHFVAGAPKGKARQGSHRHLDMLSVTITLGGIERIFDGGTGQYFGNSSIRDKFRSECCHSGISSKGQHWAKIRGPFEIPKPPIGSFSREGESVQISCAHPNGGSATRKIELNPGNVLITDHLSLREPIIRFIVSEEGEEELEGDIWRMRWDDWVIEHTPVPKAVRAKYFDGQVDPMRSIGYGRFEDCFILEFEHEFGTSAETRLELLYSERT